MSWWISLEDEKGHYVFVDHFFEGGTRNILGSDEASINVTYNYSKYYYKWINKEEGIRWLDGKKAKDTIKVLHIAINNLSEEESDDYWEATEGNARKPLMRLLQWANECPEGIWRVN